MDNSNEIPQEDQENKQTNLFFQTYFVVKNYIFILLHEEFQPKDHKVGKIIVRFLTFLIALNVITIILESIEPIKAQYEEWFWNFEVFSIIIFTTEYVAEVWTANNNPKYFGSIKGRLKYICSGMAIIDLLAILPFYTPFLFPFDLRFLRIMRMFRIFHLFTLGHYAEAFDVIRDVIRDKKEALLMTGFIGLVILIFSSILIFEFEHDAQPEVFSDLFTVMYWVGITMASITHGNIYPITPVGLVLAGLIEIIGIMFFILPTGIIASGFIGHMQSGNIRLKKCFHCHHQAVVNPEGTVLEVVAPNKPLPSFTVPSNPIPSQSQIQTQSRYRQLKFRTYSVLNHTDPEDRLAKYFILFLTILILLNMFSVMLESISEFYLEYQLQFYWFDAISVIIFTIEYVLRLWSITSDDNPRFQHPVIGRFLYAFTPMALIDLIAILPFYLPMFISFDLRFLRILRLFRFFRLFKFSRLSQSLDSMGAVFSEKKEALWVSAFIGLIMWVFMATLIYHFEQELQPENFPSIPATMWWMVMTLTSVGSPIFPMTPVGQIFSVIAGFLVMSLLALPTGIIGAGFAEHIQVTRLFPNCPKCGKELYGMHEIQGKIHTHHQ